MKPAYPTHTALLVALLGSVALAAQPQPDNAPSPPPAPAKAPQAKPAEPLPSLDDLLKLAPPATPTAPAKPGDKQPGDQQPDADTPAKPALPDASRQQLDESLKGEQSTEAFAQAVQLMAQAASRLETAGDTSSQTQRVQQSAIEKLDALISQAKKQQKKKQQQQQQQKEQQQQKDQQQQQQPSQPQQGDEQSAEAKAQAQAERERQAAQAAAQAAQGLPGAENAMLNGDLQSARAAWGNLPSRLREALMQGSGEKFSSGYQRLTEDYYRKLAEKKNE